MSKAAFKILSLLFLGMLLVGGVTILTPPREAFSSVEAQVVDNEIQTLARNPDEVTKSKTKEAEWDFSGTDFSIEVVDEKFFNDLSVPDMIVYDDGQEWHRLRPKKPSNNLTTALEGRFEILNAKTSPLDVLFVSHERAVQRIKNERFGSVVNALIYKNQTNPQQKAPGGADQSTNPTPNDTSKVSDEDVFETQFDMIGFSPGLRDDRERKVAFVDEVEAQERLFGPDHYLDDIAEDDFKKLADLLLRTLSFGHGGELVLKVKNNRIIQNREGPDFVIYENVFRIGRRGYYQEFARVGVAFENRDKKYQWFSCDPLNKILIGCAGVIPTDEGGDRFDLSLVGGEQIRYIKLRDIGYNHHLRNHSSAGPATEGFDLDAIKILSPLADQ